MSLLFDDKRVVRTLISGPIAGLLAVQIASAQLPQTRIYVVDPPGAQIGAITEVTIARGDDLDEVDRLLFSHPGIFATPVMQETPAGPQPVANKFRVAVAADVLPGRYEVRAGGLFGVSNPRTFIVGRHAEMRDAEPNNTATQAQPVPLGHVVNGSINAAGDVDVFRFSAKASQRVVLDCRAASIDSRLSPMLTLLDANGRPLKFSESTAAGDELLVADIPADGDYLVELRDLTYAGSADHGYRLEMHTDPYIDFVIPAAGQAGTTGQFTLFGFNLPGGERIDDASAGAALEKLAVDIAIPALADVDRSLPGIPAYAAGIDAFPYLLETPAGTGNTVYLGTTDRPVVLEQEPNNQPAEAQKLTLPVDVTGQLSAKKDVDVYVLDLKKDEEVYIEVIGQRMGAPLDPVLIVDQVTVNAEGKETAQQLASQDDITTNLAANVFDTATDDPVFHLKAPAEGTYRITVRDRAYEHNGGPDRVYRLVVRAPQPDFHLVAIPAGSVSGQVWPVSLRRGEHMAVDILVFRTDGFAGPIDVTATHLPFGLTMSNLQIPAGETKATAVLTAHDEMPVEFVNMRLEGRATIDTPAGPKALRHAVRAGTVVWGQAPNIPAVSRLTDAFMVGVLAEQAPFVISHEMPYVEVYQGRQLFIPLALQTHPQIGLPQTPGLEKDLAIKPADLPKDAKIEVGDATIPKGQTSKSLRVFVSPDTPPRTYTLQLTGQVEIPYRRNPAKVVRLEADKARLVAQEQELKSLVDQATAEQTAIAARLQQAGEQVAQAQTVVATHEQKLAATNQAVAQAAAALDAAVKQAANLEQEATKALTEAETARQAAASSENAAVKTIAEESQKVAAAATEALAAAKAAVQQAQKQQEEAAAQVQPATDALAASKEPLAKLLEAQQAVQAEKQKADQLVQFRTEQLKPVEEARKAAEAAAAEAAKAAEPKNVNVSQPVPPIVIVVKPAPVKLDVKLSAAEAKKGASIEATVTVTRQNGFAGPVNLSLESPHSAKGALATELIIPADQTVGIFKFTIPADAPAGEIPQLAVRAVVDQSGPAVVEAPISIKVVE